MKRKLFSIFIVAVILSVAVVSEIRLGRIPKQDPLGRELLYLPSPEMLKIMSLGNPGLAADVLYLWSIQYYSLFKPHERFLYLETIYNLITDLDPLYVDAYRVGALRRIAAAPVAPPERAERLEQVIFAGFTHEPGARLAARLVELTAGPGHGGFPEGHHQSPCSQ